jgi:chromate reductase
MMTTQEIHSNADAGSLKRPVRIFAICGSLRENSSNNILIRFLSTLLPPGVSYSIYHGLGTLPHFNDSEDGGKEVEEFRKEIAAADGIIICSPEYAFGVPGSLKNAIDWTVGSGSFVDKPLVLITAATGGEKAHVALLNILTAVSAKVPEDGALLVPFIRSKLNEKSEVTDASLISSLRKLLENLFETIEEKGIVQG